MEEQKSPIPIIKALDSLVSGLGFKLGFKGLKE